MRTIPLVYYKYPGFLSRLHYHQELEHPHHRPPLLLLLLCRYHYHLIALIKLKQVEMQQSRLSSLIVVDASNTPSAAFRPGYANPHVLPTTSDGTARTWPGPAAALMHPWHVAWQHILRIND